MYCMSDRRALDFLKMNADRLASKTDVGEELDLSDPINFIEKYVALPKDAPKTQKRWFERREYMYDVYREKSPRVILVKGRQMGMTEFAVNMIIYECLKNPGNYVYASSTLPKVSRFSKDRLRLQIERSPLLLPYLKDRDVHRITFGDSIIYLYSAYENMDALRGINAAKGIFLDEFQDLHAEALAIAEEMAATIPDARMWLMGTPKEAGTKFEEDWNFSDKKEWNKETKTWEKTRFETPQLFTGYHISQELALGTFITEAKIEEKKLKYSKQQYMNEVLGQFYTGLGRPITPHLMRGLFDPLLPMKAYTSNDMILAGVDWGVGNKANTVFWAIKPLLTRAPDIFKFETVYIEKIDFPNVTLHVERILQLAQQIPVRTLACDLGEGIRNNQDLYKLLGEKVINVHEVNRQTKPIEIKPSPYGMLVELDRTFGIDYAYETIVKGNLRIYNEQDDIMKDWIIDNFTCMYPEVSSATGKKEWKKDPAKNNDALMAYVFALAAFEFNKGAFSYESPSEIISFV